MAMFLPSQVGDGHPMRRRADGRTAGGLMIIALLATGGTYRVLRREFDIAVDRSVVESPS
jgi:hypothetical protein